MKNPKVLIGLPTMGSIHTLLAVMIVSWVAEAANEGKYGLSIFPTLGVQPVDNARNKIVQEFLKSDCTHLFFVDSDTLPPEDAIKKLLALNVPIATGLTPIIEMDDTTFQPYKKWNCADHTGELMKPDTGIQKVTVAGSSCIMIRREVFDRIRAPWYRWMYEDETGKKTFGNKDMIISEDIYFLLQAKAHGFEAVCDTSIVCNHSKTTMW